MAKKKKSKKAEEIVEPSDMGKGIDISAGDIVDGKEIK